MFLRAALATLPIIMFSSAAFCQDYLVTAQRLNIVENPDEVSRWWKSVIDTDEGKLALDTVAGYFGCAGCASSVITGIEMTSIFTSNNGNEHHGVFQAPIGYTACYAYMTAPSVNCNGTITGSIRHADDPASGKLDGLHWYLVVPKPGIGQGRCWSDGVAVVAFADASKPELLKSCTPSGTVAFHYGK